MESDDGKKIVIKLLTDFLNKNNNIKHGRYTSKGALFAKRFEAFIRNLLTKPVFETVAENGWME